MTHRLDRLNVNAENSSAPLPPEICGSVDHLTINCQVGGLFAQDISDRLNSVNNYNPRSTNNSFSNTYNLG